MSRLFRSVLASLAATAALLLFSGSAQAVMPKHQCAFCHSVHGADTGFVPRSDQISAEVLCMGCHLTANGTTQAVQPHRGDGSTYPDHYSTCTDCHEVHDNMPNWRANDPTHAAQDTAAGRNGEVRPDGWPVGVNTKLIGREDPATTNRSPYAIVLTKERDLNKDGVPDRNAAVTQTCNARVLNDCYTTGKRHVIFENRDATASAVSIHGWADHNEDGKQPTDATAWGETIPSYGGTGTNGGAPHDAICHMCHTVTAKNPCGYDGSANCTAQALHNQQRTCTDCHTHAGCFDRSSGCAKWAMPNRDLRTNSLSSSSYAVTTAQTVTLTANVTNVPTTNAITETNIPVTFNSSVEGYVGVTYIASLAPGASTNAVIEWQPTRAGSHTVTATAQPVLAEVNVANNTATAPQPVVVTVAPNHDVAVSSVTASSPIQQGNTVTVAVQVRNLGTFTETFNVTLDSNRTGKGNLPLTQTVTNLAAGGTSNLNFSWNTTGANLGTHTLTASIPAVSGETNTANNSYSTNVVVAVHDVAVTSVTAPAQVEQGSSATVDVAVSNPGGFTETFNVTLASSVDGTIQTLSSGALAAGANTTLHFTWSVGGGAPLGLRTLTATAATVAGETNTANNSASTTSTVIAPVIHDVAVNSVTAPASVNRGGGAVTVSVNVSNLGGITETFNVTLASNRDGTIQTLSSGPLAAGNSTTLNFTWTTTTATSLGLHTLTATAATVPGETNTANNSASTTTTVTSHDVAVNSVTAPASTPLGNTVTVSVQVQNVGSFTETFNVTLASNQALDGNLPLTLSSGALAAGATTTLNFSWNTTGAFVGTHTLTATAATVTGELNTANNSASTTAAITSHDVAVTSVTANPTTVSRRGTVTLTVNVANPGSFTETFNVTVSSNLAPTDGDLPQTQTVNNLAAGGTIQLTFSWSTPNAAGTHILTATAATVTGETNTANNSSTTTVTVVN